MKTEQPSNVANPRLFGGGTGAAPMTHQPNMVKRSRLAVSSAPRPFGGDELEASRFGWLPLLSLTIASGLMLVAIGDLAARNANAWAPAALWIGLGVMLVPVAIRVSDASISRRESLALATVLALGFYLVKILHSPTSFTFSDEFFHWRSVIDVVDTGRLFQPNVLLPVISAYPGLASVTAAIVHMSEATPFLAAVMVIGCARLVLTWSLFLLFWQATRSARLAGMASLVYMANPNYLFFQSEFAYESLALPLGAATLTFLVREDGEPDRRLRVAYRLTWLVTLAAVLVTHHMTSLALVAFILLLLVVECIQRRRVALRSVLVPAALIAVVGASLWTGLVATRAIGYLRPVLRGAGAELGTLATDASAPATILDTITAPAREVRDDTRAPRRQLFRNFANELAPLGERIIGMASVPAMVFVLPFGLWQVWTRDRRAVNLALGAASLVYPFTLALRLTRLGAETSNRASEYLFVAMALVAAIAIERYVLVSSKRLGPMLFAAWISVVFAGGVIVGWAPWARMPGPYRISADSRSVEPQGIEAARWAARVLGPSHRLIADRIQMRLMGTYGHQWPVTLHTDRVNVAEVVFAETIGKQERSFLERGRVEYLVIDRRISAGLPLTGVYIEQGEPDTFTKVRPLAREVLDKFDHLPGVDRLFDNGAIQLYDVGVLARAAPQ
jgi:hypothetical protein